MSVTLLATILLSLTGQPHIDVRVGDLCRTGIKAEVRLLASRDGDTTVEYHTRNGAVVVYDETCKQIGRY